jgi:hypothetical protein
LNGIKIINIEELQYLKELHCYYFTRTHLQNEFSEMQIQREREKRRKDENYCLRIQWEENGKEEERRRITV